MNICDVRAWKMCEELARECGLEIEITDFGFTLYSGSDREMALTYVDDDARSVRWYLLGYRAGFMRLPSPKSISEKPVDTKSSVPYSGA